MKSLVVVVTLLESLVFSAADTSFFTNGNRLVPTKGEVLVVASISNEQEFSASADFVKDGRTNAVGFARGYWGGFIPLLLAGPGEPRGKNSVAMTFRRLHTTNIVSVLAPGGSVPVTVQIPSGKTARFAGIVKENGAVESVSAQFRHDTSVVYGDLTPNAEWSGPLEIVVHSGAPVCHHLCFG